MTEDPAMEGAESVADYREMAADPKAAAKATISVLISRVVVAGLGWAGTVIVARSLSAEEWGQFTFVFALLGMTSIVTDLGVGRVVLARLMSPDTEEITRTATSFLGLRATLGVVGYLLALIYVVALRYPGDVIAATAIGGVVVVLATPSHALTVLFQSRHRLTMVSVAESAGQLIQLALTVLAALYAPLLLIFVLPAVINEAVKLVTKTVAVRDPALGLRVSRPVEIRRWKPMLAEAVPLALGFALTVAMQKIDMLMLSLMDTFEAVGLYSIGYKFSDMMDTIALAAAGPVSTLLVAAWPERPEIFRQRTRTAAVLFGLVAAVAVAAFWPSAEQVIGLLYGARFTPGAWAAQMLVAAAAPMALLTLGVFLLAAAGRQRHYPLVAVFGLALNVALNLVLIPRMSYNGAAFATVVTFAVTATLMGVVIARTMPIAGLIPVGKLLGLGVITAVVTVAASMVGDRLPWPVVSAAAAVAVLLAAFAFRITGGVPLPGRTGRRP
ncbi:oligosaccharide flippase family protein [Mycolicibacterium smegmatis]|uniref:oligosaccharide flippase family protein n=1 Tax=Mycolicibacterium smegmatis TaxID=1772 RepID=UPI00130395F9|nr:oligosaccharide flippase family protein [Mycolicibacterium smegmatis]